MHLIPADDARAARWIVAGLPKFGRSVTELVPAAFEAYVRVFHPAYVRDPASTDESPIWMPLPWSEIAAAKGTTAHAGMQLPSVTGDWRSVNGALRGVFDLPPRLGTLPREVAAELATVLSRHTKAPDACWFAVWNGFGGTREDVRHAPLFTVPSRAYYLLHGSIDGIIESACDEPRQQSANIWWPDDRAWCVATEIDLNTTYVGCSTACRDDLLVHDGLEAHTIDPSSAISWRSDELNPAPRTY
jgi:hypothetical protein